MIHIRNLSKSYSGNIILHDINLDIMQGEIHGLLGASGAGKSTLLRCINGIEQVSDKSRIRVDNTEILSLSPAGLRAFRKNIGMIFQDFALLQRKTALENVLLPMRCWRQAGAKMRARAMHLLECVGMEEKAGCRPAELSGGQKQRVAIARALALQPKVLLCDEATSALDPATAKSILDLLKSINAQSGITIVMVAHQMEVVKYACDRLSVLEHGKLSLTDSVENIFLRQPAALAELSAHANITLQANETGFIITLADITQSAAVLCSLAKLANGKLRILFTRSDSCKTATVVHYTMAAPQADAMRIITCLKENNIRFQKLAA
ncbi:Methionine import ATP-binding protein MetN [Mixta theicola]|nr:ATP-binding cassette domain-containing protein [Mixta theicola]QHM77422.1 Methionine import ATP-binding protein MetN [Mixta theicola]